MQIEGSRFLLRPWRRGDETSLVEHANDREVWINLTDAFPHPYTLQDARNWIALTRGAGESWTPLAIEVEGAAAGGIGTQRRHDVYRRTAGIGYWLGQRYWGHGIATEALRLVTEHAFATTDLARLEAHVFEWNPASCRVLEKAGYTLEGRMRRGVIKDGRVIDYFVYARLRE